MSQPYPEQRPRALVLTSNQPRHLRYAMEIQNLFDLCGAILAPKRGYYNDQKSVSEPVRQHFYRLESEEKNFFGSANLPKSTEVVTMSGQATINDPELLNWAKNLEPQIIFLFGTEILKAGWLKAFPEKIINLHLGISPFYRGSGTLFWPFFHNELHFVGATVHVTAAKVDAGGILGHALPELEPGDNFYTINMKAIAKGIAVTPRLGIEYLRGSRIPQPQDTSVGRLCRKGDFGETALSKALSTIPTAGLSEEAITQINRLKRDYKFSN